jgi:large subunit ribosomal protein L13
MKEYVKIDVSNQVAGRICSFIAKRALMGDNIVVVNCKNAMITGDKNRVFKIYLDRDNVKVFSNHAQGPFFPHRPDTFIRHMVWGMMPKGTRGRQAIQRVEFFIGEIPERMASKYKIVAQKEYKLASADLKNSNMVSINDICVRNGWAGKSG